MRSRSTEAEAPGSSATTAPNLDLDSLESPPKEALALVILWSACEPERVGETALIYHPHQQWTLGRSSDSIATPLSASSSSEFTLPPQPGDWRPLHFFRQRPAGSPDAETLDRPLRPILGNSISRQQLQIVDRGDTLLVRNTGRCQLAVNGEIVPSAEVNPGDTLYLRGQLLLYCTRRPYHLAAQRAYPRERMRRFGQPDADGMIGESPVMWKLREQLAACARSSFHVLIVGESGSGKELVAQAVHSLSRRGERKLIADNIAAIPPTLAAALLFGNKKNFPNPGMEERVGLIGAASGSSLFLDEIGDMPEEVQPMFLRVAERNGEYFRLGEDSRIQRSDFRLIGATNRPQKMRYELKRRFEREIHVPSLNTHREDVPLLVRHLFTARAEKDDIDVQHFLENGRPRVHPLLIEQLVHHVYTTNVSEVGFLLGHAMAESHGDTICPLRGGLPTLLRSTTTPPTEAAGAPAVKRPSPQPLPPPLQAQRTLDEHAGHITQAAAALGITRDQLNRMIRREKLVVRRPKQTGGGSAARESE